MSKTTLHVWRVELGGERFWVIAADSDDAMAVLREHAMCDDDPDACGDSIECMDDAKVLAILDEDAMPEERDANGRVSKTCAQWIRLEGRGYLAGTVW